MICDVHPSATIAVSAEEFVPAYEDRSLSFGVALVGFALSTAIASTIMVLVSMG